MAAGGDTTVMATYFHVALSGLARTWLMNLTPGSIYSWEELCARFIANFASAYQQHGVEAHLHAVRQEPRETLWTFISSKVRGTIPRISDASIITTFRQGVRDEKMLEKLATHDVETVTTLFALADKCVRAAEGRAWHSAPQPGLPRQVARVPSLRTAKRRRRRRTTAPRGHRPLLRSSQLRLGAETSATSTHGRKGVTVAMPCTPQQSPQRRGVSRDHRAREARQRAARADLQGRLPSSSPAWQAKGRQRRGGRGRTGPRVSVTRGGPEGCFSTPAMTTSRATGETPSFLVYRAEACLPPETLMGPHGPSILTSLCRNSCGVRTWTSSTGTGGKRRPAMHDTTKCSGATASGSCIVGSSGSGTWS
jgi:hypothetical protein